MSWNKTLWVNYEVYLHRLYLYRQLQFVQVLIRQHIRYNNSMYDPCYLWNLKTFKQLTWWVWKSSPTKQQLTIIYNLHLLPEVSSSFSLRNVSCSVYGLDIWIYEKEMCETQAPWFFDSMAWLLLSVLRNYGQRSFLWNILIR